MIAPVLAALGVYRDALCIWPPYASRIVFELWQPKVAKKLLPKLETLYMLWKHRAAGLRRLLPNLADQQHAAHQTNYMRSFVRVFYNGQDITQLIPQCSAERAKLTLIDLDSAAVGGDSTSATKSTNSASITSGETNGVEEYLHQIVTAGLTLCSLDALLSQVGALIDPYSSLSEACAAAFVK